MDAQPDRQPVVAVLPGEEKGLSYNTTVLPAVSAPVKEGDLLGTINIFLEGKQIGVVDLVAARDIPARPSFWSRLLGCVRTDFQPLTAAMNPFSQILLPFSYLIASDFRLVGSNCFPSFIR